MRLILFALALAAPAFSQTTPQFEVASIRPSDPNANGTMTRNLPGGRIEMTGVTLAGMIMSAWGLQPFQLLGGPSWMAEARFDIIAKAEGTPKPGDVNLMLRSLLEDRFQLLVRQETRELPVYELVLARKDGKFGPQMSQIDCVGTDKRCGATSWGPRMLKATGIPTDRLVIMLARIVSRTVVDKTGLTGTYDFVAQWTPQDDTTGEGPSLFTALQEQLGLKLESQKGPVEVLVIEKAEKPAGN